MHIICHLIIILFTLLFQNHIFGALNEKANNMIADFVEYREESNLIYAKGNIKVVVDNYFLTADNLLYDLEADILWAEGNVSVKDDKGKVIIGEKIVLKDKFKEGVIDDFILSFGNDTIIASKLAQRISVNKSKLFYSRFTPCEVSCNKDPIWQISAKNTDIDFDENRITYKHAFFEVYGIPVFYLPYFSHPTPQAEGKSGILTPELKDKGVAIPLYLRAKPNLDFTFTPRVFGKYKIYELETRYKTSKSGSMKFEGSYGNLPYFLEKNGVKIKNEKVNSYHFITNGSFGQKGYNYGFNIERVSDKAYLKNYYQNYTPYLTSRVYLNKIKKADYFLIEGLNFQDLNSPATNPSIFSRLKTKNIINLDDNENTKFLVRNDSLVYKERKGSELARTSFDLALTNNLFTSSGQIFYFTLRNRVDLYFVQRSRAWTERNKVLTRNIPEFQTTWRYPLVTAISSKTNLVVEPIVSATIGRKFVSRDNEFVFVDPTKYELSEENIFHSSRYSGIDCHEFGKRLNYGINSAILLNENYLGLFLGQSKNIKYSFFNQSTSSIENVGKISGKFTQQLELFYRFRKDSDFKPIRDEVGGNFNSERFNFTGSFAQLSNVPKYYARENRKITNNRVRQFYYDTNLLVTDNWSVGYGMRIDLSSHKPQLLSRTIKVTYFKDCVRIAGKISSDYMYDNSRGIKKTLSSPSVSIGLKILNM